MEAGGVAIGAVAMLAPAVQACWGAYGVYQGSTEYGRDYQLALRKIMAQRLILEGLMRLRIEDLLLEDPKGGEPLMKTILGELVTMRNNFETCSKLINKLAIKSDRSSADDPALIKTSVRCEGPDSSKRQTKSFKQQLRLGRKKIASQTSSYELQQLPSSQYELTSPPILPPSSAEHDLLVHQALSQPAILAAVEAEMSEGNIRQNLTPLRQRVQWTLLHKKVFNEAIQELSNSNNNLRRLIQIKATADPKLFQSSVKKKQDDLCLSRSHAVVKTVHNAILSINGTTATDECSISMRFVERHEETQHLWSNQGIDFSPGTVVVQVQAQRPSQSLKSSLLLLKSCPVQRTSLTPSANPATKGALVTSLNDAVNDEPDETNRDNFKLLGHIGSFESDEAPFVIYQDMSASWVLKSSLAADLRDGSLQNRSFAAQHIALASLVALPYVQCHNQKLAVSHPRPQHFQFYDHADEIDPTTLQPVPYACIGIGSKPPRPTTRSAGRYIPAPKSLNIGATELGLLLYQIGSWTPLDYLEGYHAMETMRDQALKSLDNVVKHSGLGFARIVELCFCKKVDDKEESLYQEVLKRLQDLGEELR